MAESPEEPMDFGAEKPSADSSTPDSTRELVENVLWVPWKDSYLGLVESAKEDEREIDPPDGKEDEVRRTVQTNPSSADDKEVKGRPEESPRTFKCDKCGSQFLQNTQMNPIMSQQPESQGQYLCKECKEGLSFKWSLCSYHSSSSSLEQLRNTKLSMYRGGEMSQHFQTADEMDRHQKDSNACQLRRKMHINDSSRCSPQEFQERVSPVFPSPPASPTSSRFENDLDFELYATLRTADENVRKIYGTTSQAAFEDENPCTAMAAVALVYGSLIRPKNIGTRIIDEIIKLGALYYRCCRLRAGHDELNLTAKEVTGRLISEWPPIDVEIHSNEDSIIDGKTTFQGIFNLDSFAHCLRSFWISGHTFAILTLNFETVACMIDGDEFYIFDSHCRGDEDESPACLLRFTRSNELPRLVHDYLLENLLRDDELPTDLNSLPTGEAEKFIFSIEVFTFTFHRIPRYGF